MKALTLSLLSLLLLSISACSKYEEGQNFTLVSKKSRLVGNWKLVKQTENDVPMNLQNIEATASILENGTFKTKFTITLLGFPYTEENEGTWKFNNLKTQVIFTENGATNSSYRTIVRLAKDELKLKEKNINDVELISTFEAY